MQTLRDISDIEVYFAKIHKVITAALFKPRFKISLGMLSVLHVLT